MEKDLLFYTHSHELRFGIAGVVLESVGPNGNLVKS